MTDHPFRDREFRPVAPADRPRRTRRGVRVVVTDGESVLLFVDTDPGVPGSRWYVTPGGGIDPGEGPLEAAVRELREETGLEVAAADLRGPVLRRVALHGYSDQICAQSEDFYVLRTPRFELDVSGHTPDEQLTLAGHAWLPIGSLAAADAPVWPAVLPELLARADAGAGLWDMGTVEESTVPVAPTAIDGARRVLPGP